MASTVNTIEQESYVTAIAEIVSALVKAYELQVPINLSKIKGEISKKHKYDIGRCVYLI